MSNDAAMRVEVTNVKAPWPTGVRVGDIVEIPRDELPGCFIGKCKPAGANRQAKFCYEPPKPADEAILSELSIAAAAESAGNVDFLINRRDALRARMQAIDLPAAEKRVRDANATLRRYPGGITPGAPGAGELPEQMERRLQYERALIEAKASRVGLRSLQQELETIGNDLKYVEHILGAEERVETTRVAALAADAQAAICKKVVSDAEAALQRIVSLVEVEEKAYRAARDGAGARLLKAIKLGSSDVAIDAASRDKVATLEVAKSGAEEEHQVALAALQSAEQARRSGWQQVRLAQADAAELAFRQVERQYVDALIQVYVAKNQARASAFGVADPRIEARSRSEQICQSIA
jgi:hypothetical protein